jgi:hypothetical protein
MKSKYLRIIKRTVYNAGFNPLAQPAIENPTRLLPVGLKDWF